MTNVFDGKHVHVMESRCSTCTYRPGNLMHLEDGRREQMERDALDGNGVIPCHKTIHGERDQEAVCRGYFDHVKDQHEVLRLALAVGIITYDETE